MLKSQAGGAPPGPASCGFACVLNVSSRGCYRRAAQARECAQRERHARQRRPRGLPAPEAQALQVRQPRAQGARSLFRPLIPQVRVI